MGKKVPVETHLERSEKRCHKAGPGGRPWRNPRGQCDRITGDKGSFVVQATGTGYEEVLVVRVWFVGHRLEGRWAEKTGQWREAAAEGKRRPDLKAELDGQKPVTAIWAPSGRSGHFPHLEHPVPC